MRQNTEGDLRRLRFRIRAALGTERAAGSFRLVAPRPRGVGVRGVGGGVGCPPRGDAAARCHFNHNPLIKEHKGRLLRFLAFFCLRLLRLAARLGRAPGGSVGARAPGPLTKPASAGFLAFGGHGSVGATENYMRGEV